MKDSHCQEAISKMNTILGRAHVHHKEYKAKMAKLTFELAEKEILARKCILCNQYCEASIDIAEGLFLVGKVMNTDLPTPSLSSERIAFTAIYNAYNTQDCKPWLGLWFIQSADKDNIKDFYATFQRSVKYIYDQDIKPRIREQDKPIIEYVAEKLRGIMVHLTTELWDHVNKADTEKKCNTELAIFTERKGLTRPTKY